MNEKDIFKRIYVSVVTFAADWRQMVKEVRRYRLKEISLFLTDAEYSERKEIYAELEKTQVKEIPHVHARHDFKETEFDYLAKRFKTKAFTTHYQYLKNFKNSKHLKKLFIESNCGPGRIKSLKPFEKIGGLCIDLSHIAFFKEAEPADYEMAVNAANKFTVGCNHVSAFNLKTKRAWHVAESTEDLDYLAEIDRKYFSNYICIELGNPIKEQLVFRKYVAKLLAKSWKTKS